MTRDKRSLALPHLGSSSLSLPPANIFSYVVIGGGWGCLWRTFNSSLSLAGGRPQEKLPDEVTSKLKPEAESGEGVEKAEGSLKVGEQV